MFPFQMANGFINCPFPYNMSYQVFRTTFPQMNSYNYPHNYQNFGLTDQSAISNYPYISRCQYFAQRNHDFSKKQDLRFAKKKRITKKLSLVQNKKQFRNLSKQFKNKKKTLKYFDPSRAPPITSLRNNEQLQLDLHFQQQKLSKLNSTAQLSKKKYHKEILKLQILLRQPNQKDYPFLICKKRKYYRNLKRRYSVAYFQQRASYINNKLPIPTELHPKNKVRKSRPSNRNGVDLNNEISQSFDQPSDSSLYCSEQNSEIPVKNTLNKVEQKDLKLESQVKEKIPSPEPSNSCY